MTHYTIEPKSMFRRKNWQRFFAAWWLVTSPLTFLVASPSHTDYILFNLPSSNSSNSDITTSLFLICPSNLTIGFTAGTCAATVQFPMPQAVSTVCPGAVQLTVTTPWGTGNGPFQQVGEGVYPVECRAVNACGEVATCSFMITVRDIKKPVIQLKSGIHGNITPDGKVVFFARQFDQHSYDDCTPAHQLRFSFSNDPADTVRQFFCHDLGLHEVNIVVKDAAGNVSTGKSSLQIMDGMGYCTATRLQGRVRTPEGKGIREVAVALQTAGNNTIMNYTDAGGGFIFNHVQVGRDYVIRPFKNGNPLNGVNSYDLKLLNDHILGNKLLDSPYKIIAADVNGSGKVTTADMVVLRKMILGEITAFPDNTPWRFVPAEHTFAHPMHPFATAIPEWISLPALSHGMPSQNFVGIKTGDLNYSAIVNFNPAEGEDRSASYVPPFYLITENQRFRAGDALKVTIRIAEQSFAPEAFQFTLNFDMDQLELGIVAPGNLSGMAFENVGLSHAAQGKVTCAWQKSADTALPGEHVIQATFKAKTDGNLADALSVGSLITDAAAFDKQGNMRTVELKFKDQYQNAGGIELKQNSPNPFVEMTLVEFSLPREGTAALVIYDQLGKRVFEKTGSFRQGENQILLLRNDLMYPGIYTFNIETDYGFASRKLVMF